MNKKHSVTKLALCSTCFKSLPRETRHEKAPGKPWSVWEKSIHACHKCRPDMREIDTIWDTYLEQQAESNPDWLIDIRRRARNEPPTWEPLLDLAAAFKAAGVVMPMPRNMRKKPYVGASPAPGETCFSACAHKGDQLLFSKPTGALFTSSCVEEVDVSVIARFLGVGK